MIRPPKAITLGATSQGKYEVLYVGDDVGAALIPFEKQPKGVAQIFFFKRGILTKTRETSETLIIREAKLKLAEKESQKAHEKALAARKSAEAKAKSDKEKAVKEAQAASAKEREETQKAKARHEAEVLKEAANDAESRASE